MMSSVFRPEHSSRPLVKPCWGGTVGAGLKYAFAPNWSVGVEYNHIFLDDRTIELTTRIGGFGGATGLDKELTWGWSA